MSIFDYIKSLFNSDSNQRPLPEREPAPLDYFIDDETLQKTRKWAQHIYDDLAWYVETSHDAGVTELQIMPYDEAGGPSDTHKILLYQGDGQGRTEDFKVLFLEINTYPDEQNNKQISCDVYVTQNYTNIWARDLNPINREKITKISSITDEPRNILNQIEGLMKHVLTQDQLQDIENYHIVEQRKKEFYRPQWNESDLV